MGVRDLIWRDDMRKKYLNILVAFLLLFCLSCSSAVYAEGGEQAASPGVSGEKPLSFLGIILEASGENVSNAVDIPLKPKFTLSFDKNVVNSLFWENNSKCFNLITDSGDGVPIKVTKVDDTIDFSQRQNIFVEPVNALQPGTAYKLTISPDLMAKNGVATIGGTTDGKGITISFRTVGEAAVPANTAATTKTGTNTGTTGTGTADKTPVQQSSGDNQTPVSSEIGETSSEAPASVENQTAENTTTGQNKAAAGSADTKTNATTSTDAKANNAPGFSSTTILTIIGAILIIGWIAVEIYVRRKKKMKG